MRKSVLLRVCLLEDRSLPATFGIPWADPRYLKISFAPDQTNRVKTWLAQPASHLKGWFEGGLQTIYFVLCEPNDANIFYFVEMGHAQALDLLYGITPASKVRKEEFKINVPEAKAQLAAQLPAQRAIAAPAEAEAAAPVVTVEAPAVVEAPAEG